MPAAGKKVPARYAAAITGGTDATGALDGCLRREYGAESLAQVLGISSRRGRAAARCED